jgi:tetratricopeptide (TPR) repeat protein
MPAIDPYSPCPCGSGQKFKWCCQKVESYAERAQRLSENGQSDRALDVLDEGLRKERGNAWLLIRKALIQVHNNQSEAAEASLREILKTSPAHAGALALLTRLVVESEGAAAGAAQLQHALSATTPEHRPQLAGMFKIVGVFLSEVGLFPAAIRHLRHALSLETGEPDQTVVASLKYIETNPAVPPWEKNPYQLAPAPEKLSGPARERFEEALRWAEAGLWASAGAAFETLADDPVAGPLANRNLGFCRLWIADQAGALAPLRRYIATLGPTTEAVDLEALCQILDPPRPDDIVERVRLEWPVRDRAKLVETLAADPNVLHYGPGTLEDDEEDDDEEDDDEEDDDEDSPEVEVFSLLDRPPIESFPPGLKHEDVPTVLCRVFVGQDTFALESFDDGRLDALVDRLTTLAGASIRPAHPRTKVLGEIARDRLALVWTWLLPPTDDRKEIDRIQADRALHLINELWTKTPNQAFRGRTPLQAAAAGDSEVPLRAAIWQFERGHALATTPAGFAPIRERLHIGPEPEIDPETVDVGTLHVARLGQVPVERLSDEQLGTLYLRASEWAVHDAHERATRALIARPGAAAKSGIGSSILYSDLANVADSRGEHAEALEWVRRGRQADPAEVRAGNAPAWDFLEFKLKATHEEPEVFVPELQAIMERYGGNQDAMQIIMSGLFELGLLRAEPDPDHPGQLLMDARPLKLLLQRYGPKIATSSGRIGVSATKPEIWTPGGAGSTAAGSPGAIWTPGAGAPAPGPSPAGTSKVIYRGQ